MTHPKPALDRVSYDRFSSATWFRNYELLNQDGSPINGRGCIARCELWNEPRTIQYTDAEVTWMSINPAVVRVSIPAPTLFELGNENWGDLLIIHANGRRQYLVEIELVELAFF